MAIIKKACKGVSYPKSSSVSKRLGSPSKAKSGGSFPDLNKDGKITKADILKGRGVIAKKGMKVKKAKDGDELKPRQYKRLGRIAEKNPERVERVADRMNERSSRITRGKEIAQGGRNSVKEGPMKMWMMEERAKVAEKKTVGKPNYKKGGKMTKKCMYGCK